MMLRILFSLAGVLASAQLFAFPCYLTLAKDSCWTNYDVTVTVTDAEKNQQITTITVPKGKSWARQAFSCEPGQKLKYEATFQPVFWKSEEGKVYPALRFWLLPTAVQKNDTAWDIPVCYPEAFASVPLPPDVIGNCQCNLKNIPAIKPQ